VSRKVKGKWPKMKTVYCRDPWVDKEEREGKRKKSEKRKGKRKKREKNGKKGQGIKEDYRRKRDEGRIGQKGSLKRTENIKI
jgi:hypothetical protein